MTARRHHYLPQCYLRGFSQPRKGGRTHQVHVYDRSGKAFTANIANIAVERDFNRVEVPGQNPDILENGLAEFESELAVSLGRIAAQRTLDDADDKANLLNFIALASVRNPRLRGTFSEFEDRVMKSILELSTANKERWQSLETRAREAGYFEGKQNVSYEDIRDFVKRGEFKMELPREQHIVNEFKGFDAVLPHLFRRRWGLLRAPQGSSGFVTCDHPVFLYFSDPKLRGGLYGPGHGMNGTELVFPVTRMLAVVGTFEGVDVVRDLDEDGVARVNGAATAFAKQQVYARDPNPLYSRQYAEKARRVAELPNDTIFVVTRGEI
ncbi:MAG TPA: DUF4238 domain-containing protein [Xanthobacteraceae bacterium]|nr:DUF4238 domain-containing protein [Xanthobacteraceae bacterium]